MERIAGKEKNMFRPLLMSFCSVVLYGSTLVSGQPASTAPAPEAPSIQPVTAPVNPVVLVLPISPPPQSQYSWLGKAIQQDMVADLGQMSQARVIAPASVGPASDEQAALDQARQVGAGFVVYGVSQVAGNELRVTGEVLDVATAKPLGSLKATAPITNLFPLEDSLAAQAVKLLPYPLGMAGAPQSQPSAEPPPDSAAQTPTQNEPYVSQQLSDPTPYYSYTESLPRTYYVYNPYYYYYPYWGYPYSPYWGGVSIGFGGGYFWHHHGWYGGRPFYGHPGYIGRGGAFRGGGGFHGGGGHRR
jgi:TolB-like protein